MKRWWCGLLLAWALASHAAIEVTDDRGRAVRFAQPPQRIVTLLPSLTETVCALGACSRLVAVDNYSNWPATVAALPHVGGVDDASIEAIVAARPDVVLLSNTSRALARLESLGVPVLGLDMKTMGDVRHALERVARVLGSKEGPAAWNRLQAEIDAAAGEVPPRSRRTTVYVEVGGGYAASASSHIGEILTRLGATNVVPGELGTVPKLNPEFVVRADPQLILVGARSAQELPQRPGWNRIRAVRERRLCILTSAQGDVLMRPGPRLGEAARVLAKCLRDQGTGAPSGAAR